MRKLDREKLRPIIFQLAGFIMLAIAIIIAIDAIISSDAFIVIVITLFLGAGLIMWGRREWQGVDDGHGIWRR